MGNLVRQLDSHRATIIPNRYHSGGSENLIVNLTTKHGTIFHKI